MKDIQGCTRKVSTHTHAHTHPRAHTHTPLLAAQSEASLLALSVTQEPLPASVTDTESLLTAVGMLLPGTVTVGGAFGAIVVGGASWRGTGEG